MQAIKILVVEDDLLIGEDIVASLRDLGYAVTGPITNVKEARSMLLSCDFDLLLIDIGLEGEHDGIVLAGFVKEEKKIPFIFLTSHDEQQIVNRAKAVQPSAYLLKPISARSIDIAIDLALNNFSKGNYLSSDILPINDSLFLKKNNRYHRVPFREIQLFKADGNYTEFHTKDEKYIQTILLSKVEQYLPNNQFIRVHRSYVVNISAITGFEGNMLIVDNNHIPVSTSYRDAVFQLFRTI